MFVGLLKLFSICILLFFVMQKRYWIELFGLHIICTAITVPLEINI